MDNEKILRGLLAARDGLTDAYKRLGFAPHEIANNDVVLPKINSALVEIRESVELFDAFYEVIERDIDYARAQQLGASGDQHLWTIVEGDNGNLYVTAGWAYVNRLEYLITKEPWSDSNEAWLWAEFSDDDEDGDEDDEEDDEDSDDEPFLDTSVDGVPPPVRQPIDLPAAWKAMGQSGRVDPDLMTRTGFDLIEAIGFTPSQTVDELCKQFVDRLRPLLDLLPDPVRAEAVQFFSGHIKNADLN